VAGETKWREKRLPAGPTTKVRIDVPATATGFDYAWTVLDVRGREIATVGTKEAPLRLELGTMRTPVVTVAEPPIWKRWWLWTIVGAVAAGAVTTTVVLATRPSTPDCPTNAICTGF
jgi:hypothetical protein